MIGRSEHLRNIEAVDKRRGRAVIYWSMSHRGKLSWADWFVRHRKEEVT